MEIKPIVEIKNPIIIDKDQLLDIIDMLIDCKQILLGDNSYYKPPYNENYRRIKHINALVENLQNKS